MELRLSINCGEKTCAIHPGHFCEFLRVRKFGTIQFCGIWYDEDEKGRPLALRESEGWLLRRPECLAAQEKSGD
jgi:hypothetical protein